MSPCQHCTRVHFRRTLESQTKRCFHSSHYIGLHRSAHCALTPHFLSFSLFSLSSLSLFLIFSLSPLLPFSPSLLLSFSPSLLTSMPHVTEKIFIVKAAIMLCNMRINSTQKKHYVCNSLLVAQCTHAFIRQLHQVETLENVLTPSLAQSQSNDANGSTAHQWKRQGIS